MNIKTLSVVVPAGCPNKCKFCVSRLHSEKYANQIEKNRKFRRLYRSDYQKRLLFARQEGFNTLMYTGSGEPLMNTRFIEDVAMWNRGNVKPFEWIELQTSGVGLDEEKLRWLRNEIEVSTICLSVSSIWSSRDNAVYNGSPEGRMVDIPELCYQIKKYDFNLRLALNMTDVFNGWDSNDTFGRLNELNVDQVVFRKLYAHNYGIVGIDETNEINKWIAEHSCHEQVLIDMNHYIKTHGRKLDMLSFGAERYAVNDISAVINDTCMTDKATYLVLRPDCKLYTKWDDTGSLLF